MAEFAHLRSKIAREVFDYQVLQDALSGYRKPRDKVTQLLANGTLIRIRKGLYCFSEAFRRESVVREYLANLIYGPSYVSLEFALSHHGLIPERVETVTSVTPQRPREFFTPFGAFSYRKLNERKYSVGAALEKAGATTFLIATAEKALADKVWTDKRFSGSRIADFEDYLLDDLRVDPNVMNRLDMSRLEAIASAYRSTKIDNLVRFLKRSRRIRHA
ncbi:MAG: hypothetical protein KAY24_05560 [Candidatus Eisenbacteria sp.]|nr:hypothetical protein [Candidatus Eisenbacteria bacterium]